MYIIYRIYYRSHDGMAYWQLSFIIKNTRFNAFMCPEPQLRLRSSRFFNKLVQAIFCFLSKFQSLFLKNFYVSFVLSGCGLSLLSANTRSLSKPLPFQILSLLLQILPWARQSDHWAWLILCKSNYAQGYSPRGETEEISYMECVISNLANF